MNWPILLRVVWLLVVVLACGVVVAAVLSTMDLTPTARQVIGFLIGGAVGVIGYALWPLDK